MTCASGSSVGQDLPQHVGRPREPALIGRAGRSFRSFLQQLCGALADAGAVACGDAPPVRGAGRIAKHHGNAESRNA